MNIIHIGFFGHRPEGIGSVLINLAYEQSQLGHIVKLMTITPNIMYKEGDIVYVNNKEAFSLEVNKIKPDIVIFHGVFQRLYLSFSNILRISKIPYLVTLHGALSYENYKKNHLKKKIALLLFFGKFLKLANSIVYLNKSEYCNSIVPKFNLNYSIIPNGCYLQLNSKNKFYHSINRTIELLFVGRMDIHHKGLDILFESLKIAYNNQIKFHITFCGNIYDNQKKYFKERFCELSTIVTYNGIVFGKEKEAVFESSQIFILTSRFEGMPMSVLEALSYGLPCILTPGTNMADEVESAGAGWKCDFNALSIANTIEKAIKDYSKNPEQFINASFNLAHNYSWKQVANISCKEYNKVVKSSHN